MRRATKSAKSNETHEKNFYPRSPCGERPISNVCEARYTHFYPRSPCGERPPIDVLAVSAIPISIHALLAESDPTLSCMIGPPFVFLSTLSLRRATRYGRPIDVQLVFLSTLSLRRATVPHVYIPGHRWISIHALLAESDSCPPARPFHCHDFYPRSPCGERHA